MPIRIMHVVEALGVGGGVENGIANVIAQMDPRKFNHVLCAVFDLGTQIDRSRLGHVEVMSLAQKRGRGTTQMAPLAEMIRRVKPDIVHSRNWGAIETVFAGRWVRSCRVIHSEHGVEMNPDAEPRRRGWLRRGAFEMAHHVFSVSFQLREMLAERTGFPLRKMGVIHNGVDSHRFRPDPVKRRQLRSELGLRDQEFCIGCVGRLNQIKDYPTLLRAAELFGESCPSWSLLIVGDGAERNALEEFVAATAGLRGHVRFLGQRSDIPEFLNAIDAYALPSLCEGISNSLLEAMATGLPAVASKVGGNPEVVVDRETGLLFPIGNHRELADRLVLLYQDFEYRARLARAAVQRVKEQFSLEYMVRQYEEMYAAIASGRTAEPHTEKAFAGLES